MTLTINGKRELIAGQRLTVAELLQLKGVAAPQMVSVQLNGQILDRGDYAATFVHEGDRVEFLYLMGGGAGAREASRRGAP